MPTASVARMPPSTPQITTLPTVPSPKIAVTMSIDRRRDPGRPRRREHPREQVADDEERGEHGGDDAEQDGDAGARRRGQAPPAVGGGAGGLGSRGQRARLGVPRLGDLQGETLVGVGEEAALESRPTARITSSSPSRTASAAARGPRPPGACRPSSDCAAMCSATSSTRCSTSGGSGVPAVSPRPPPAETRRMAVLQVGHAFAARSHRGHHGDAEVPREHLGVRHPSAPARFVGEVERDDHPVPQVEQLQRQVEAAREVGRVGHGDDDVRTPVEHRSPGRQLVLAQAVERVAARAGRRPRSACPSSACRPRRPRRSRRRSARSRATRR